MIIVHVSVEAELPGTKFADSFHPKSCRLLKRDKKVALARELGQVSLDQCPRHRHQKIRQTMMG